MFENELRYLIMHFDMKKAEKLSDRIIQYRENFCITDKEERLWEKLTVKILREQKKNGHIRGY